MLFFVFFETPRLRSKNHISAIHLSFFGSGEGVPGKKPMLEACTTHSWLRMAATTTNKQLKKQGHNHARGYGRSADALAVLSLRCFYATLLIFVPASVSFSAQVRLTRVGSYGSIVDCTLIVVRFKFLCAHIAILFLSIPGRSAIRFCFWEHTLLGEHLLDVLHEHIFQMFGMHHAF